VNANTASFEDTGTAQGVEGEAGATSPLTFSDLGLSEKVLKAVTGAGYTIPTPIQSQAIPHVLQRKDVLGIAQTGTGKTAAFTLPMITLLEQGRARARMPRTLILEPTRELAAQVEDNFNKYGVNHKLNVALLIGGVSFGDQDIKITRGVDVLIATPGRLLDHHERGKLLLTGVELLVIDEADRMLDMGFIPDIERICKLVPFTRQTLFFTATMPPEIQRITEQFLHNPVRVEVSRPSTASATITQRLVASHGKDFEKRETLRRLITNAVDLKNGIIFCNRKRDIAVVHKSLQKHGFPVACLHGDMDQRARLIALDTFRSGEIPLLIASDVAARGLDIPDVSHVFNYDVPFHAEDYVHRIGRTGRAGRLGHAAMIVTRSDDKALADIEKLIQQKIEWDGVTIAALPASLHAEDERPRPSRGGKKDGEKTDPKQRGGTRGAPHLKSEPKEEVREPKKPLRRVEENRGRATQPREEGQVSSSSETHTPEMPQPVTYTSSFRRENRPVQNTAASRPSHRSRVEDDLDPKVLGLGDHVPAFLLRSTAILSPAEIFDEEPT
jgi:superfamily II DNA/RNA helicase